MSKRTVLIAVDKSQNSEKAVEWANENYLRKDDVVLLCHVYYLGVEPSVRRLDRIEAYQELEQRTTQEAKDLLHRLSLKLTVPGIKELLVFEGDAREIVPDLVKKYKADAVMVGSRGLSTVKGLLMGSVSSYIVQHSDVPVFVIR